MPPENNPAFNDAAPDSLPNLSGLEFLQHILDGRIPPPSMATLLGFYPVELEKGRVVFAATPDAKVYNPLGTVHGGFAAAILDSCMGCAIHSRLKAGKIYTTLEMKVIYIRAMTADTGEIRAEGKVIHVGRHSASAEGRLTDSRGRLLAHATTTCLILSSGRSGDAA